MNLPLPPRVAVVPLARSHFSRKPRPSPHVFLLCHETLGRNSSPLSPETIPVIAHLPEPPITLQPAPRTLTRDVHLAVTEDLDLVVLEHPKVDYIQQDQREMKGEVNR